MAIRFCIVTTQSWGSLRNLCRIETKEPPPDSCFAGSSMIQFGPFPDPKGTKEFFRMDTNVCFPLNSSHLNVLPNGLANIVLFAMTEMSPEIVAWKVSYNKMQKTNPFTSTFFIHTMKHSKSCSKHSRGQQYANLLLLLWETVRLRPETQTRACALKIPEINVTSCRRSSASP